MKKMYVTPVVSVIQVEAESAFMNQSFNYADSKKFSGNKFGSNSGSSFQNDGTFGGQKSPWEEND